VATTPSILIVDDEFGLAEMLREMLRESGFEVTLAINGRLALEILDERTVDLVLTDMMMPVMDGAELAAAMRSDDKHRDTPIIMMTSLPTARPQSNGLFDAVLRKPFTPELLLETIRSCMANTNEGEPDWTRQANDRRGGDMFSKGSSG
jgi:CheY-like chemotaxis protein